MMVMETNTNKDPAVDNQIRSGHATNVTSLDNRMRGIQEQTHMAIRCAELQDLRTMMQDTNSIITTLNRMISEVSAARRIAINRKHQQGTTYRAMADEIGISYQRVAEIAKGKK